VSDEKLDRNKAIMRRMLKAFNGEEDKRAVKELFHPQLKDRSAPIGLEPELQRADVVTRVQAEIMRHKEVFPDRKFKEVYMVAEGDMVVLRWEMTGTHEGEVLGRKGSGKKIKTAGTEFVRIQDGKIVEHDDDPGHVFHLLWQLDMFDQETLKRPEFKLADTPG
jgi:predicted ester cyclase